MNLLFIRHGEKAAYEGDVTAVELTAKGWDYVNYQHPDFISEF